MSDIDLSQVPKDDLEALMRGDLENITKETLGILLGEQPKAMSAPRLDIPGQMPSEFLESLAQVADRDGGEDSAGGQVLRGLAFSAGQYERGFLQLGATPQGKLALAQMEEKARADFAEIDAGLGPEDIPQLMVLGASMLIPGGGPVQGLAAGGRFIRAMKNIPKSWGPYAAIAGITEFFKGRAPDESRAGSAATAAGVTALGGVAGNKVSKVLNNLTNSFSNSGAYKTMAALMGTQVGPKEMRRIFREGISRKFARSLTGKSKDHLNNPLYRAFLRQGGQEDARMIREAAKAQASTVSRPGPQAEDIDEFLEFFPKLVKGTRPGKAAKEMGMDLKAVRGEAETMMGLLQENAIRTNSDGTAYVDIGILRSNFSAIKKSDMYTKIFSPAKQKQLNNMIEAYSKAAMSRGKGRGDVRKIFQEAQNAIKGERSEGMKAAEEFFNSLMPRSATPKVGAITAVGTWMVANEVEPGEVADHIHQEGWLGFMDLVDSWTLTQEEMAKEE